MALGKLTSFALALLLGLGLARNAAGQVAEPATPAQLPAPLGGLEQMVRQTQQRLDAANQSPELTGSGPYPARMEVDLALPDFTIYRPADLASLAPKKLGVMIWGNGGCTNDGASARAHLAEIASHGYLVIAPGKPLTGPLVLPGAVKPLPMTTSIQDLRTALDWALAENGRAGSPYHGRIDPALIAAAGHSCGGMLAVLLGDDPRIRTVIMHNIGIVPVLPDNPPLVMHAQRAQGLHTPVLLVLGGKSDVGWNFAEETYANINNVPVFYASIDVGHGGTFDKPHGGAAARVALNWLEWQLRKDTAAAKTFVGPHCVLCVDPQWSVKKKQIP